MTILYSLFLCWMPLGVPEPYLLAISAFYLFFSDTCFGEDSDRPSQGQMLKTEPITCFVCAQWSDSCLGPGRRQKSGAGSFPKEKPGVLARWKGTEYWIMKAISAPTNTTVLTPCPVSQGQGAANSGGHFPYHPPWYMWLKSTWVKEQRKKSEYGKSAILILIKIAVLKFP